VSPSTRRSFSRSIRGMGSPISFLVGRAGDLRAHQGAARQRQKLDPEGTAYPAQVSPIMIPDDPDDLHILAGEYVLGVLDEPDASEVAEALATNSELRRAVTFWERQLHPLSQLAAPVEQPFEPGRRSKRGLQDPRQSRTIAPERRCGMRKLA
jgi:hypothetical protein